MVPSISTMATGRSSIGQTSWTYAVQISSKSAKNIAAFLVHSHLSFYYIEHNTVVFLLYGVRTVKNSFEFTAKKKYIEHKTVLYPF